MSRKIKHNRVHSAVLIYFFVAMLIGMALQNWLRWFLVISAPCGLLLYMAWSIRDSKRKDWLPPDPVLGRTPDPFLSGKKRRLVRTLLHFTSQENSSNDGSSRPRSSATVRKQMSN